ncbi:MULTISPECIES: riboflavin synthase [unclassified Staphylococcus]|uniref:riboflavin synthase n=1 Tax=unclassified Staphylococcus TaxID=91994 RepID=UPI0021D15AE3|nr:MULTISPECIES: riboflavin synthase [unclassified Staphylococcus]UXR68895.1 riboflavin synthase [Staphylococcus sp. IVB6246]UXR70952.1 riboflavin synthase [Staphylococcus sp. IVB6240]UXR73181.1 riboflavin synthase [Staphylococcus sp. IVB6238]UXR75479.1 riboflavin synthase [Staphylococcus sp. IVB6233]UXR79681.1 riboflavin synthase [Staphylococcus sp. IVB6218]
MFTGIVEEIGTIQSIKKQNPTTELTIQCEKILSDMHIGDSISVNGTCLTVVRFDATSFTVQVITGTENKTYLGTLSTGQPVNLERALLATGRLGGHFVQGHVDDKGTILNIKQSQNEWIYTIKAPDHILKQMIPQGAIAVDGVSLTVFKKGTTSFDIHLIPETRKATILSMKRQGDPVHLETDMLFKYVENITRQNNGVSMDSLLRAGF